MPNIFEQCVAALQDVLNSYAAQKSCPCAFPRFRQLASFHFRPYTDTPVGCHISQLAIGQLTREGGPFTKTAENGPGVTYACAVCGSTAETEWDQFNINMELTTLKWTAVKPAPLGAEPLPKIPMPSGFFGLGGRDTLALVSDAFSTNGSFEDMQAYLKELRS